MRPTLTAARSATGARSEVVHFLTRFREGTPPSGPGQ